ncbi:hypothetical protein [Fimbriimonas ginsengisoli]|uniref:mannan endo-1,4-beta-mannosidase n=1 Tax=Fimbriimonas ginsengisoli Gsoil 348 TaxID=661478 RepID=A0A068NTK2_FIMGI|nr:hypothetical protein [Fimbriimonas ginsengisoli]AIE86883.1 hypothetical protein OP10G_3515 [Fimbriimonas ginsengisoli Gsoil 348]
MILLLAAVAIGRYTDNSSFWYGPVTVTEAVPFTGNPFDPDENEVDAEFTGPGGVKERRLAYFVGDGKFSSTLVAHRPGSYAVRFFRNGKFAVKSSRPIDLSKKVRHGFIGLKGKRFQWSDGTPYFPIGYDYGWRQGPNLSVAQRMLALGRSGGNWSRIWTCHWDNKNPFFPAERGAPVPSRQLRQEPLRIWDDIVNASERAGVDFQFVLFHHGPYSTTTDSNWKEHPWNTANGGFLADPTDFFSDPEAKKRSKIWLRYAVARYAHSPAVMSWELFNEVQWVDAVKLHPERVKDVAAWHAEMARYIRSLDPYHHLVTSSSSESLDSHVFDDMDYMQPHTYPANVLASIGGYRFKGKPGFFGEFGPPGGSAASYAKQVRDGIYGGILAGHAGAGMYWYWDQVDRRGLGPMFGAARKVIDESGLLNHSDAKPVDVWCETPRQSEAVLAAGLGWGKSSTSELNLPKVGMRDLGGWSQYFQSLDGSNKGWAKPLVIHFDAKEPGKMVLNVGGVSSKGGTLQVWINDHEVLDQKFDPPVAGARPSQRTPISLDYPSGRVTVRIENHGGDWVRLDSTTIPAQAPTASAHGMSDGSWALIRVFGTDTSKVRLSGTGLRNGHYAVVVFDTVTGRTTRTTADVSRGTFEAENLPSDSVLAVSK